MATILCVTNGLPGMLFTSMELARRLVAAGHQLTYASFPHVRETVINQGFDFLPLEPSQYEEFLKADSKRSALQRLGSVRSRRERAKEALALDGFVDAVRRMGPDLILIDGEMHEQIIAASTFGAPMALLNTFVSIWRRPGLPPPHHLVYPGVGWKGSRIGTYLLWELLRLRKWWRAWSHRVKRIGCDRISVLRQLAEEYGFDFDGATDDGQWLMPFTYRRLPVISLHALEFEFPHDPPPRVSHVGPMLLEMRVDDRITDEVRAKLETIFERRRREGRKLIYAGFGSFFSASTGLLRRLFEAVRERSDWELVVSLGGRIDPAELGTIPERVHAFSWLPQLEVLRHTDAAVTHGAINTTDECVVCGVPMLIYCGFETEMGGTTARAVHHGIAIAGDAKRDTPSTMGRHIDKLLIDGSFQENLNRLGKAYTKYTENRVAERTVESLLKG